MIMKNNLLSWFLATLMVFMPVTLFAKGDLTAQQPITKTVQLGNIEGSLRFYPADLEFETGKLYKLVIKNPSKQKHYFSAETLARSVFTRKVQVMRKNTVIAEVKGVVNEIEVYPGGEVQWWFVPVKTSRASRLHCSIKGHSEAGMTGRITIK